MIKYSYAEWNHARAAKCINRRSHAWRAKSHGIITLGPRRHIRTTDQCETCHLIRIRVERIPE